MFSLLELMVLEGQAEMLPIIVVAQVAAVVAVMETME
jgi:hypothetical protein